MGPNERRLFSQLVGCRPMTFVRTLTFIRTNLIRFWNLTAKCEAQSEQ